MIIKNTIYVEANVMNMSAKFQLHPPYGFWGGDLLIFFRKFTLYVAMATNQIQRFGQNSYENLPFMLPWQPIKFSDLDKIHTNPRGLLKKHFCKKKNLNICSETAKIANLYFSHYNSMATISCHSNQSSYPIETKKNNYLLPRPIDAIREIW